MNHVGVRMGVKAVLNADGTGMLVAEADMDTGPAAGHIFIVPNVLAATRPQLHQLVEHDDDALQAYATAIQLPAGASPGALLLCAG